MKKFLCLLMIGLLAFSCSQPPVPFLDTKNAYLGQTPPGSTPEVFARGIVSTGHLEHSAPRFSPAGTEVFWEMVTLPIVEGVNGKKIMSMNFTDGKWSIPRPTDNFPLFTSDGAAHYLSVVPEPVTNKKPGQTYISLLERFPELQYVRLISMADNRTIYFLSFLEGPMNNFGIYRSEFIDGQYVKPEPLPSSINKAPFLNWTPFIAPDESYLLFSSNRREPGVDWGDLFISYRLDDGLWSDPIILGDNINSPGQERFPGLSPDGKYLFFTRPTNEGNQDVFWVDAGSIKELNTSANK